MSMARMDKWIPGVSPDDRTSDVAGRTLRFRLAAVQHYLPLAAEKPSIFRVQNLLDSVVSVRNRTSAPNPLSGINRPRAAP